MSSIRMAGNCVSSGSPNMPRRKCGRFILPRLILRKQWADPALRAEIIAKLEERGIDFDQLRSTSNQPEADPFDLLCHLAFNGPLRTRRERADRVKKEEKSFFEKYGPEARAILADLLEKYAEHGTAQFVIPDVLKVPPISERGNVIEIAALFGGPERLREAVNSTNPALRRIKIDGTMKVDKQALDELVVGLKLGLVTIYGERLKKHISLWLICARRSGGRIRP